MRDPAPPLLIRLARLVFSPDYARLHGTRRLVRSSGLTDQRIAEVSGFANADAFRNAFAFQYGLDPLAYRHLHAGRTAAPATRQP